MVRYEPLPKTAVLPSCPQAHVATDDAEEMDDEVPDTLLVVLVVIPESDGLDDATATELEDKTALGVSEA